MLLEGGEYRQRATRASCLGGVPLDTEPALKTQASGHSLRRGDARDSEWPMAYGGPHGVLEPVQLLKSEIFVIEKHPCPHGLYDERLSYADRPYRCRHRPRKIHETEKRFAGESLVDRRRRCMPSNCAHDRCHWMSIGLSILAQLSTVVAELEDFPVP